MRAFQAGTLALVLTALVPSAQANGRYPFSQQLLVAPNDAARLWLRASYGFLTSPDSGRSWSLVCEEGIGYSGTEDPSPGVTADGRVLAGLFDGLATSEDHGCSFAFQPAELAGRYVVDLTVERADPRRVLVLVSQSKGGGRFRNELWRSVDAGRTFARLGPDLEEDLILLTLDPSPSDPRRIHLTALGTSSSPDAGRSSAGFYLYSEDDGASFRRTEIPGTSLDRAPFLAAVHPSRPEVAFLRVNGAVTRDGGRLAEDDALLVTRDAGLTFEQLDRRTAHLGGFALSPDGTEMLVGWGDAHDGVEFDRAQVGLFRWSADAPSAATATRLLEGRVSCATWTPDRVFVCGSQFDQGFELGVAPVPEGPYETLTRLDTMPGPISGCPAGLDGGAAERCAATWPALCPRLRGDQPGNGCPTKTLDAGGDAAPPPPAADEAKCACRTPGGTPSAPSGGLVASLAASVALLRRRAR